jgi:hypothetical protein
LAGLASVAQAQGDRAQALSYVQSVLALGKQDGAAEAGHMMHRATDPFRVYLVCYQVLQAADDPRSGHVLKAAHALLQERAASIDDQETRHAFLHNVTAHREIAEAWQASHPQTG